jgi:hypothetical protein
MGPANCRGLLKFAMSSIAACPLDASIPGRRRRRSVWFSWSPPLETGTIGRNFGASNCQLHLSAKIQKTLLDIRALAGGGFWGGFRGVRPASARYSDRGQETASFWGPSSPQRQYHPRARRARPVLGHHAAHECRQCGLRQSRTAALSWARSRSRSK